MTLKEELQLLAKNYRWAFEELVVDQKMQEANRLLSEKSIRPMFDYLVDKFGSGKAVLGALRGLLRGQKARRKTLVLD